MAEVKHTKKVTVSRIELPTPFPVGPVNAYVLQQDDTNVLVDCGPKTNEAKDTLLSGLSQLGIGPKDLSAVVLTHGHVDHVGLCRFFRDQGIPVFSHPDVQSWLDPGGEWDRYRRDFYGRYYAEMGMPESDIERALFEFSLFVRWNDRSVVDVPLRHGDVLPILQNYEIIEVPGHAQAAIALYDKETGELVVGDQLLPTISSNAIVEPTLGAKTGSEADYTHSLLDYRRNLQYLRTLNVSRVYPGHGEPFEDAAELLDKRLREQENRREKFLTLLRDIQPATAYQVAAGFFPHRLDQPSLILSETLGYLDWLENDGLVEKRARTDGTVWWESI